MLWLQMHPGCHEEHPGIALAAAYIEQQEPTPPCTAHEANSTPSKTTSKEKMYCHPSATPLSKHPQWQTKGMTSRLSLSSLSSTVKAEPFFSNWINGPRDKLLVVSLVYTDFEVCGTVLLRDGSRLCPWMVC